MRTLTFTNRNMKEILRDPITLFFGLGFPVVLLLLLTAIQSNVPESLFALPQLAPGMAVFGLSFLTLFSATLIARDRESALLQRLYTTPLTPTDFILGYGLPLLPLAVGQSAVCYTAAVLLGLPVSVNLLYAVVAILPVAVFYVALGLLCGSLLNVKQVGGVCGALLTNLSAWLSGVWFDLALVGGVFEKIAHLLPFYHAVAWEQAVLAGDFAAALPHLLPVLVYALITTLVAIRLFLRQMQRQ